MYGITCSADASSVPTAAEYSLEERARMRDHEELEMIEVRAQLQGFKVELFRG